MYVQIVMCLSRPSCLASFLLSSVSSFVSLCIMFFVEVSRGLTGNAAGRPVVRVARRRPRLGGGADACRRQVHGSLWHKAASRKVSVLQINARRGQGCGRGPCSGVG